MDLKVCTKCGQALPKTGEYFYKQKGCKDGLRPNCKSCSRVATVGYRVENREKMIEQNREYYQKNKEEILVKQKQYYLENKERHSQRRKKYSKKYYKENYAKIKKYRDAWNAAHSDYYKQIYQSKKEEVAKWAKLNRGRIREQKRLRGRTQEGKEKMRQWRNTRRARIKKSMVTLTIQQWEETVLKFNKRCAYCGKEGDLTQDHFIPVSLGGHHTQQNIVPACLHCNISKYNRDFFEWYPMQESFSETRFKKILKHVGFKNSVQQIAMV